MEYLDYYDSEGKYLGFESREKIHGEGLWHKTVHCWLYDKDGNIYFQIRKDSETLYTTASGHVLKGETIKEAFKREIFEEIGIEIDSSDALLVDVITWKMDKIKSDGTIFKDRAWASVYIDNFEKIDYNFDFDKNEVLGLVKMNVYDVLKLFKDEIDSIDGTVIKQDIAGKICLENRKIQVSDFLVTDGETVYSKYSDILLKVIEVIN